MTAGSGTTLSRLRRFARSTEAWPGAPSPGAEPPWRARAEASRCELCSAAVAERHPHLWEPSLKQLRCACPACAVLFDGPAGAAGAPGERGAERRLVRVPDRVRRVADAGELAARLWQELEVPVDLAFVVLQAEGTGTVVYPGAAGPVVAPIAAERAAWLASELPALRELTPEVEALLVDRRVVDRREPRDRVLVLPLDEAYRLAGVLRRGWRGLSGGPELARELLRLLSELEGRAGPAEPAGPGRGPCRS